MGVGTQLWRRLIEGRPAGVASLFADDPRLDDPQFGPDVRRDTLEQYVASAHNWLQLRNAETEPIAAVATREREVEEAVLSLRGPERRIISLPVAVVGDRLIGACSRIRIYYSLWPLIEQHSVRSPLLTPRDDVELPDFVARYHEALARADVDTLLGCFEPDASFREPAGQVHAGQEALRSLFSPLGGLTSGTRLEPCTVTDDGSRCAVEYNCVSWLGEEIPPQPGVAVYDRGPEGRIAAARIYDDVGPPEA